MDWEEAREKLRKWREDNSRNSEEIIETWLHYLEPFQNKLGDEKWMVLEQVLIAAFDTNELSVVSDCYGQLSKKFPDSRRVMRLKGMRLEMMERYEDALALYDAIIHEDETNSMARKRRIAVLKAQARNADAIKELTEYLKKFMSDSEAWQELSDLYLKEGDYAKAAFCLEEILLASPINHLLCCRYAEIKYTQGGQDNIDTARSYFCQAIKLKPNCVRALYGLLLTCNNTGGKSTGARRKELQKLSQYAGKLLNEAYKAGTVKHREAAKLAIQDLTLVDKV